MSKEINELGDNTTKIKHPNGVVGIELGLVDGEPKLVFYNAEGIKLYEAGMNGIVYNTNIAKK